MPKKECQIPTRTTPDRFCVSDDTSALNPDLVKAGIKWCVVDTYDEINPYSGFFTNEDDANYIAHMLNVGEFFHSRMG